MSRWRPVVGRSVSAVDIGHGFNLRSDALDEKAAHPDPTGRRFCVLKNFGVRACGGCVRALRALCCERRASPAAGDSILPALTHQRSDRSAASSASGMGDDLHGMANELQV